jgi:two-component system, response regulator PdtaR
MNRLLFVEDDRLILATITSQLVERGFAVDAVDNLADAEQLIGTKTYDLALLDYRIGSSTGLDFAASMLKPIGLPFIFLTAYADHATVDACLSIGAFSYLTKPFEIAQLEPVIKAALARSAEAVDLEERGEKLEKALRDNREISVAIGILMERFGLAEPDAFSRLRDKARSERRKVQDLAADIVKAVNLLAHIAVKPKAPPN